MSFHRWLSLQRVKSSRIQRGVGWTTPSLLPCDEDEEEEEEEREEGLEDWY